MVGTEFKMCVYVYVCTHTHTPPCKWGVVLKRGGKQLSFDYSGVYLDSLSSLLISASTRK